ncbi:MAG: DUF6629 family protein [Parachlamydiales bacterium]|jgi:hypothetical protein
MCFSAEASLGGAAVLGIIGYATLKKTSLQPSLQLIAIIPLMFALQQLSEGFIWLSYSYSFPELFVTAVKYIFLLFAFIIWPFWIPFAFSYAESPGWRLNVLRAITVLGAFTSLTFAYTGFSQTLNVIMWGQSLRYLGTVPDLTLPYVVATVLPFFITSIQKFKWVGVGMFGAFLLTLYIYFYNFISVWCFFAALLSAGFYLALREEPERSRLTTSSKV